MTIKRHRARPDGPWYYSLQVIVAQVSGVGRPDQVPPVIAKLAAIGGNYRVAHRDDYARPNRRPLWHWQITGAQAEAFLRAIRPYMVGKADQADVALDYRERAVGKPGHNNPAGRPLAEAAYLQLRAMKNYTQGDRAA